MGILSGILGGGRFGSTRNDWLQTGLNNDVVFDAVNDERDAHDPKKDPEKVAARIAKELRGQGEELAEDAKEAAKAAQADGEKVTAKELLDAFWEGWELRAVREIREIRVDDEKARREDEEG